MRSWSSSRRVGRSSGPRPTASTAIRRARVGSSSCASLRATASRRSSGRPATRPARCSNRGSWRSRGACRWPRPAPRRTRRHRLDHGRTRLRRHARCAAGQDIHLPREQVVPDRVLGAVVSVLGRFQPVIADVVRAPQRRGEDFGPRAGQAGKVGVQHSCSCNQTAPWRQAWAAICQSAIDQARRALTFRPFWRIGPAFRGGTSCRSRSF